MEKNDQKINENLTKKMNYIEKEMGNILLLLGISANLQGFQYIKESVKLTVAKPETINAVTKVMYPTIAQKFKTSVYSVERAIRHALSVSYNKKKMKNLNKIFGLTIFTDKDLPTNAEFVAILADKLSNDIRNM